MCDSLLIIDKFVGAGYLLNEMKFVKWILKTSLILYYFIKKEATSKAQSSHAELYSAAPRWFILLLWDSETSSE